MFRTTIRADENTDVETVILGLRRQCEQAKVASLESDLVITQAHDVLAELVERGRQVAARGSQMTVTREVTGDGVSVKLIFRANDRRSLFERLVDTIKGR